MAEALVTKDAVTKSVTVETELFWSPFNIHEGVQVILTFEIDKIQAWEYRVAVTNKGEDVTSAGFPPYAKRRWLCHRDLRTSWRFGMGECRVAPCCSGTRQTWRARPLIGW